MRHLLVTTALTVVLAAVPHSATPQTASDPAGRAATQQCDLTRVAQQPDAGEAFSNLDRDGDDSLSREEFQACMAEAARSGTAPEPGSDVWAGAEIVFSEWDIDGDAEVSRQEFDQGRLATVMAPSVEQDPGPAMGAEPDGGADVADTPVAATEQPPEDDLTPEQQAEESREVGRMLLAENIVGREVFTMQGDPIGELSNLVIDRETGALHAVLTVGSVLGVGEKRVAFDVADLRVDQNTNQIVLVNEIAPEDLEDEPAYEEGRYEAIEQ